MAIEMGGGVLPGWIPQGIPAGGRRRVPDSKSSGSHLGGWIPTGSSTNPARSKASGPWPHQRRVSTRGDDEGGVELRRQMQKIEAKPDVGHGPERRPTVEEGRRVEQRRHQGLRRRRVRCTAQRPLLPPQQHRIGRGHRRGYHHGSAVWSCRRWFHGGGDEEIEKAADRGDLTELILMVIWNRLDVARRDDERDAIRSLDLLYRRVEAEILKSEATPAMRLLNELLNLHYGGDDDKWLKKCRKRMLEVFPREDPFTVVFPASFNMEKREGRIELPPQDDDLLLRVDFVREVDELLKEVQAEQEKNKLQTGYDPESVANMLKQQEKMQTIRQVESLLELASSLKW